MFRSLRELRGPDPHPKTYTSERKKYWAPGDESLQGLINYQRDLKMIADWFNSERTLLSNARGEDEALWYPDTHTPAMDLRIDTQIVIDLR